MGILGFWVSGCGRMRKVKEEKGEWAFMAEEFYKDKRAFIFLFIEQIWVDIASTIVAVVLRCIFVVYMLFQKKKKFGILKEADGVAAVILYLYSLG